MFTAARTRTWALLAAVVLVLSLLTGAGLTHSTPAKAATVPTATLGILPTSGLNGVPDNQKPNVENTYLQFDPSSNNFPTSFVNGANAAGATPFIELEPWEVTSQDSCPSNPQFPSMTTIAANGTAVKNYLNNFGTAIKNSGHPVILTFAHEFNIGGQYPWSESDCEGTTPAQWVAAWDVVHADVDATAGGNAFFMWAPNVFAGGSNQHVAPYWPGASEVDMVGVDGYPGFVENGTGFSNTFQTTFGETFSEIKALTSLPVFVSETNLQDLGAGGFDSITKFMNDLFADNGTGILEFEDGLPPMTNAQWSELDTVLAAHAGSTPPPTPTPTPTTPTPTPTPTTPTPTPTPTCTAGVPTVVPPSITTTVRGSFVQIGWGSVAGASTYEVHINLPDNVLYKDVKNPGNSVTFSPVPTTGTYHFGIRAMNCAGNGPWSPNLSFKVLT